MPTISTALNSQPRLAQTATPANLSAAQPLSSPAFISQAKCGDQVHFGGDAKKVDAQVDVKKVKEATEKKRVSFDEIDEQKEALSDKLFEASSIDFKDTLEKKVKEATEADQANETGENPKKPTVGTAAKNVFKAAFDPWSIAGDIGIGALLAVATAIIPPHAHALAMIPFSLIIGTSIRAFSAIKQTYWPPKG